MAVSPDALSIRKNGGTGTLTVTLNNSTGTKTVTATTSATNLSITPASRSVDGSAAVSFVIKSENNTRGNFSVTIESPCGSKTVAVSVTN